MQQIGRREFLAAAGSAAALRGANDRVNVAVVGLGGRSRDHIRIYSTLKDCRLAALCDIDEAQVERAAGYAQKLGQREVKTFRSYRRLLEDKSIDAVSLATPNHWHALQTIWACQAGKDVYVEKPASHSIWEGRKMVEAARRYNCIVQVGMQNRTIQHKMRAVELLREGVIGEVYMAKGICYKRRRDIGHAPDSQPPPGVDYDAWLGPAPMRPFNEKRFHYNWHWFWDTGNGDIGNQGIHEMDYARWGLGKAEVPGKVHAGGGLYTYGNQETPNTLIAEYDYGDSQLIFEVRGLPTNSEGTIGQRPDGFIGNLFYGSKGWMSADSESFHVHLGDKGELAQEMKCVEAERVATAPHIQNFLEVVRSRNLKDLKGDIQEGHISAMLVHMANISYRTGRSLRFDPATETFLQDAEANAQVRQHYRAPYVVPEKV
jgi:predicted dehydrogenase